MSYEAIFVLAAMIAIFSHILTILEKAPKRWRAIRRFWRR